MCIGINIPHLFSSFSHKTRKYSELKAYDHFFLLLLCFRDVKNSLFSTLKCNMCLKVSFLRKQAVQAGLDEFYISCALNFICHPTGCSFPH